MELQEVLENRRSIRKYKDEKVSKEDILKMIDAAIQAPSWKNSQTARYYIAMNDAIDLVKDALPAFNQKNVENAPVLIVTGFVANRSGFERDGTPTNELGNEWGAYDLGLHNENLLLKAKELGLGTLVMGIRNSDMLKENLNIPENVTVVSVISVGYPDIDPQKPKRKETEDIAIFYE